MKLHMFPVILLMLLLVGCAKPSPVKSNSEPLPDLSAYQTYQWPQDTAQSQIHQSKYDELDRIIRNAIAYHLERKGLQPSSESPDLQVSYSTNLRQTFNDLPSSRGTSDVEETAPWTSAAQEPEGTLSIDLVDLATEKSLWRGTAKAKVNDVEDARSKIHPVIRRLLGD
ncbi:MAG: hypothetical protein BA871_12495 [Desulfuromonadales bacterium C00003096]|jgi:hypothetical protein|nr:MAG: hypothetical protein BA871_12495 [Desulfuromonadales bacterium C00003096]